MLGPLGIGPQLQTRVLDQVSFDTAPAESNRIWIAGKPLEEWIGARTADEVIAALREAQAAVGPVYSIADIVEDPHVRDRETLTRVDDPELGPLLMQNMIARLTTTPGEIRHPGPPLGRHNDEVYGELGLSGDEILELRRQGAI